MNLSKDTHETLTADFIPHSQKQDNFLQNTRKKIRVNFIVTAIQNALKRAKTINKIPKV